MYNDVAQRENISRYYDDLEMPGGYTFNTVETLKLIELYYNSKFASGQYDSRGFRKLFYNIVVDKCNIARKFVDLDTKDIQLHSMRPDDEYRVWLLQRELKQYLKDKKFGLLLNKITFNYPKYGHVFIKKTNKKWDVVNIQNLRFDPASDSLDTDTFFYEQHMMSLSDLKKTPWDKDAIKELQARGMEYQYAIYECYDYGDDGWHRTIKGDLYSRRDGNAIKRSIESKINSETDDYIGSVALWEDKADPRDFYRELRWETVPGRRLGQGFVEALFDNQMAENEAENLERKGLYFKALQLWQTRDQAVGRNVLTDAENGDILTVDSELTPVQKENSDLAAFNSTRSRWTTNSEQKTFAFDISRGENLPSRTPAAVANLSAAQVASFFDYKREEFGEFVRYLVIEDVLPSFEQNSREEHILTVLGNDPEIDKLDKAIVEQHMSDSIFKYVMENGILPDEIEREQERTRITQDLRRKKNRYFKIPKNFFANSSKLVDVVTTGEQIDVAARQQTLTVAMQTVGSNPAILQNKATRTILFKMLELGGISPIDLNIIEEQAQELPQEQLPQGGSIGIPGSPQQQLAGAGEAIR